MRLDSVHWDWEFGVCRKHWLPSLPCPACLAEPRDRDVEEIYDETDELMADWEWIGKQRKGKEVE